MRYAFISDLHANLQAWRAVHVDIRASRADYIICLGDLIGYGPSPAELLDEVHTHVDAFVLGNHDAAVSGRMDDSSFTPQARTMIRWTASKLNRKAASFLRTFPLTLVGNGFRCTHGEFSDPARFEYVLNPEEALPSWRAVDSQLLLAGHTHDPAFFLIGSSGIPRQVAVQDFEIEPGKRYFINVGSVGHPRDGDPRASYCIYDTDARAIYWRRVPFDLAAYRTTLVGAGLDPDQSHFLKNDPTARAVPLRQRLDFAPPQSRENAAKNVPVEADFRTLRRSVRRWKSISTITLLALCALLAITVFLMQKPAVHKHTQTTRKTSGKAGIEPGKPGETPKPARAPRRSKRSGQNRITNPENPFTSPGSTTTRSTREETDPVWHQQRKASMTGSAASASMSTEPSSSLRTYPLTPSEAALDRTDHRNPTP